MASVSAWLGHEHGAPITFRMGCTCSVCVVAEWERRHGRPLMADPKAMDGLTRDCSCGVRMHQPGRRCSRCHMAWLQSRSQLVRSAYEEIAPASTEARAYISRSVRRAVYARDEWTCQLCLDPVDRDASGRESWGATLDHIIPWSLGGSDKPENLRLAHLWCNVTRGDGSHYADEDFLPTSA